MACSGCGGPIYTHNKHGYCQRTPECRKLARAAVRAAARDRQPKCKGCERTIRRDNTTGFCRKTPLCRRNYDKIKNYGRYTPVVERASDFKSLWRDLHPDSLMWTAAKSRAARKGIEFAITREDIRQIWTDTCPVFGYELAPHRTGTREHSRSSFSLDRIDPQKGYVPGNIQILSQRANSMKSDASPDELLQFAAWIQATYGALRGGG